MQFMIFQLLFLTLLCEYLLNLRLKLVNHKEDEECRKERKAGIELCQS